MMAAERIAEQVEPGTAAMSADTARRAEGFVVVEPLGRIRIGRQEVELVALRGRAALRSRWDVRVARGLSRFTGRQREVDFVHRALQVPQREAARSSPSSASRAWASPGSFMRSSIPIVPLAGPCLKQVPCPMTPVWPIGRSVIFSASGLAWRSGTARLKSRERRIDAQYLRCGTSGPSAAAVRLDIPVEDPRWRTLSPQQRQRQTLAAIRTVLMRESRRQPLVLLVEDLHWIDGQTQAALDALVDGLGAHRLLLLVTYRPGYRHDWAAKSYFSQVRLDPFPAETAETFLSSLLRPNPELTGLRRMLVMRTEGTPLFLEEAVRTLAESGALTGEPGNYRLAAPIDDIALPSTVQAVIAARIDRLPARSRVNVIKLEDVKVFIEQHGD